MTKFYKFMLQPYRGPSTRHQCPKCGDKHSFTYYIDKRKYEESGEVAIFSEDCGRCDNENSCGYLKYPQGTERSTTISKIEEKPKVFYTKQDILKYSGASFGNNLVKFLIDWAKLDAVRLREILKLYCVGSTSNRGIVFWQIDENYNIHRGKIMWYNINGHREKHEDGHGKVAAMWQELHRDREIEPEMCYFGQHLLGLHPEKPIALVESEKTAIIATYAIPDYNWMATSSLNTFQAARLMFLKDFPNDVYLFPDCDGYEKWQSKAEQIKKLMPKLKLTVNSFILRYGKDKEDLADVFLRMS